MLRTSVPRSVTVRPEVVAERIYPPTMIGAEILGQMSWGHLAHRETTVGRYFLETSGANVYSRNSEDGVVVRPLNG